MKDHDEKKNFIQRLSKVIPALGIILGLLSGFAFGLALVLAKLVFHVNPFTQLLVRGLLHYAICFAVSIFQQNPIIPRTDWNNSLLLLVSAAFSAFVPVLLYTSFYFISVADSTAIMFTYPATIAIISALFLGEKCKILNVLAVALSVAGSVLVSKPSVLFGSSSVPNVSSYMHHTIYGVLLAGAASISFAMYLLCLRKLSNFAWPTVNLPAGVCLVVFAAIAMATLSDLGIPNCGTDGLVVIAAGLLSTGAVALTILACQVENPQNVSVSQTIEMPIVIIFQIVILGTLPDWNSYVGTTLIIISVLMTWGMKCMETKKLTIPTKLMQVLNSKHLQESSV